MSTGNQAIPIDIPSLNEAMVDDSIIRNGAALAHTDGTCPRTIADIPGVAGPLVIDLLNRLDYVLVQVFVNIVGESEAVIATVRAIIAADPNHSADAIETLSTLAAISGTAAMHQTAHATVRDDAFVQRAQGYIDVRTALMGAIVVRELCCMIPDVIAKIGIHFCDPSTWHSLRVHTSAEHQPSWPREHS